MGGATEHDEAMRWFLERANGGDVLVIRASGSNGYNDYLYTDLGITVNSVETIVFNSSAASSDPYVLNQISRAEAIWIAGGDQWNYVSYWRNTQVEELLNNHMLVKQAPIGGTSAGMAILGQSYFSAQNGTVTSATALANPFNANVTIGSDDFLSSPFLSNCISDTHYDDPDRRGRHMVFLARLSQNIGSLSYGIACDEYTAVCIDENGLASAYGYAPDFDDNAYFIQVDCEGEFLPEICMASQALDWNRNQAAVKVYHISPDASGTMTFDLSDWMTGVGGDWQHWWVENGVLMTGPGTSPDCPSALEELEPTLLSLYPNPSSDILHFSGLKTGDQVIVYDMYGHSILGPRPLTQGIQVSEWSKGSYVINIFRDTEQFSFKWLKE